MMKNEDLDLRAELRPEAEGKYKTDAEREAYIDGATRDEEGLTLTEIAFVLAVLLQIGVTGFGFLAPPMEHSRWLSCKELRAPMYRQPIKYAFPLYDPARKVSIWAFGLCTEPDEK